MASGGTHCIPQGRGLPIQGPPPPLAASPMGLRTSQAGSGAGYFRPGGTGFRRGHRRTSCVPPYPAPAAGARRKRRGRMRTRGRPQPLYGGGGGGDGGLGRRPGPIFALATGLLHVCHRQRPLCRNLGQVRGLFLSMTSLLQAQNSTQGRLEPLFKRMSVSLKWTDLPQGLRAGRRRGGI